MFREVIEAGSFFRQRSHKFVSSDRATNLKGWELISKESKQKEGLE